MKKSNIKAVILVAGDGGRLLPISRLMPKSLLPVGGKPLLWYNITNLIDIGVDEMVFVTGHQAGMIKQFMLDFFPKIRCTFIYNDQYHVKNSIYSFYCAKDIIYNSNFLRLAGDLFFNKEIPLRLCESKKDIISAVEHRPKKNTEDFAVTVNRKTHTIIEYGKHIPASAAYGIAQGIDYVSKEASGEVINSLNLIIHNMQFNEFPEFAFQKIIDTGGVVYYQDNVPSDFWCDIDTPEDLLWINDRLQSGV